MPLMVFYSRRIRNMYILLFWIIIFLYPHPLLKAFGNETSRRCRHFSTTESFEVGNTKGRLLEVHLRQNVRGEVEIVEGEPNSDSIRIDVDKSGPTVPSLDYIVAHYALYDVGKGMVYVVQVDYIEPSSGLITIVAGAVFGTILLLAFLFIGLWFFIRRKNGAIGGAPHTEHRGSETSGTSAQPSFLSVNSALTETPGERGPTTSTTDLDAQETVEGQTTLTRGSGKCLPPPPPRRAENLYSPNKVNNEDRRLGGGGVGSPRGLSKSTLVSMSVICAISLAYAACPYEPHAKVLIYLPPVIQLETVKLFFTREHKIQVITDKWQHRNHTQLHVYDVDDASYTSNMPCSAEKKCSHAYIQNLAGCDAATNQCICQRGYALTNGLCTDIDECQTGQHSCPSTATCQNEVGSYRCQCGYGYYGDRGTCLACSVGCPTGEYEQKACSNYGDRSCQDCTPCSGSMYEARPCHGNQDRRCMHVAHPLLITGQEGEPTFLEAVLSQKKPRHKKRKRLKVETSENVFTENLHATRNLETTYYVTDAAQASDFFWERQSGLKVHIGIIDAHLIAKYEDETHNSDNKYMVDNPNTSEDKAKFRNIVKNYCRHPIPDYYSITLEISRDRITTAQSVVCDSTDPKRPSCPSQYSNGDTYLYRSLNEACQKMGTFPDPLMPAANSIVCTKNTALLRDIFNQTYAPERPINFPPRRCRNALTRCKQCLNQLRCAMIDIFDQQCCQIDCYTLRDCKLATSSHCTTTPVECAMGDAYRYTIQPVFQNLKKDFQCHVKHKKPNALYTMFFHIKVPGPYGPESELDTPRVYKTIYAHDFDFQSLGSFDADYISVEHSTGLDLQDEFIIKGNEYVSLSGQTKMNYTLFPMRTPDSFSQRKVVVHEISHNIFVASTQFESPFAYSTSSWVKGNECDKDIRKFKYVQPHHLSDGQNVNVMIQNVHSPYEYFIKSVDNPPYIRFMVPGNTSVLPWYFRGKGPVLYTNDSLNVLLELQNEGRIWSITLSGEMSFCPGYLSIIINDLQDAEELFRYDALIFCPTSFNMSFKVPNRGQKPDRTFEMRLEDAKKSYRIYLYHMIYDYQFIGGLSDVDSLSDTEENPWTIIIFVIMSTGTIIVLLNVLYLYFEFTKMKKFYAKKQEHNSLYAHGDAGRVVHHTTVSHNNSQLSQKQYVFIVSYVVFRIVYSLVFTFTVFDAILGITLRNDIWQMSDISHFQMDKYNDSRKYSMEIENFGQGEILRQSRKVTDMQGACSNYIEELFDQMLDQIDNVTLSQQHSRMYSQETSLGSLIEDYYKHKTGQYLQKVQAFGDEYMAKFSKDIKPTMNAYRKYLERVYNNDWFQFPQLLFNQSEFPTQRELVFQNSNLTGTEVDFAAFLPVEEVEDVQLWPTQWGERFERMRPKAPPLNVPGIDPSNPSCDTDEDTAGFNFSMSSTPKNHLDASRFFSTPLPGKSVRGPKVNSKNLHEEYKFLTEVEVKPPSEPLFSMDSFVKDLNLTVVRLILLALDILVFFYRCCRTFMTARTLCQGFEETKTIPADKKFMKDVEKLHEQMNTSRTGPSTTDSELSGTQLNLPDYITSIESHKRMLHPTTNSNAAQNGNRHFATNEKIDNKGRWTENNGFCQKLLKVMQNCAIPKLAVGLAILTLFIIIGQLVTLFFSADVFVDINGFRSFLVGLDTQVNQTNWYLREQAKHFNDITIEIYKGQMRSEMLHLQSLVEYFNQEHKRLADNYIAEGCIIRKGIIGNRTCDISVSPAQLDISMVPCNFIPIQPQLYTDLQKLFSPAHLARDFSPILDALRSLILKSGYAILVITAIMLLVHFIGAVLLHFLRTRHKFPVHRTYVTSFPNVIAIETTKAPQEGQSEEDEEEEEDNELKTYQTRVSSSSPEKLKGLLANFKYSETKV